MKRILNLMVLCAALLAACGPANLDAPMPAVATGVDANAWASIPAGSFLSGQEETPVTIGQAYQMMVTDVTVAQYTAFLNKALAEGALKINGSQVVGPYPGDVYHGVKHEIRIDPGDYLMVPLNDPASPFSYAGNAFAPKPGWDNHPMTNVSWVGAWKYCGAYGWRLPSEVEWEKAARGSADNRPFPWGSELALNNANYYKSGDPFEDMATVGSRTSPVGFYNGKTYNGYVTANSASPYGLYDMAGNVWQWLGDIQEGSSDRLMHGGSKAVYHKDLRIWVRNSAPPTYTSVDVGFRCARTP